MLRKQLNDKKLPVIDPEMKLVPTIKAIGSLIVLFFKKLTLSLFELFWIPINNIKNKLELKNSVKIIFCKFDGIYFWKQVNTNIKHILYFSLDYFSLLDI